MKRWRCIACHARGIEAEWEDHRSVSFCRDCGSEAVRLYEFGCFQCREEGITFFDEHAPSHPCPECGSDAFRVVYAPAVIGQAQREGFAAADKMLVQELERQKISTTSLKRDIRRKPDLPERPFAGHWANASELLPAGSKGVGGRLPFGMPRPITQIVGKYDGPV